ncbi:MAG: hypothetical protein M1830_001372, partial [Pleopsidium flavum]
VLKSYRTTVYLCAEDYIYESVEDEDNDVKTFIDRRSIAKVCVQLHSRNITSLQDFILHDLAPELKHFDTIIRGATALILANEWSKEGPTYLGTSAEAAVDVQSLLTYFRSTAIGYSMFLIAEKKKDVSYDLVSVKQETIKKEKSPRKLDKKIKKENTKRVKLTLSSPQPKTEVMEVPSTPTKPQSSEHSSSPELESFSPLVHRTRSMGPP